MIVLIHLLLQPDNNCANTPAIYKQDNNHTDMPAIYRLTDRQALCSTTITTRRSHRTAT